MKEYIILIGTPCSGKSTWCNNYLKDKPNTMIVSRDNILMEHSNNLTYSEAWDKVNHKQIDLEYKDKIIQSYFYEGNVIIDATNMTSKRRISILSGVVNFQKTAIVFNCDKNTFIERNNNRNNSQGKHIPLTVYENMLNSYEEPTEKEGFDKIFFVKN